ncbi:MAG: DUF5642 family protein [Mycobacterium sp.]
MLLLAGCSHPAERAPAPSASPATHHVNPDNVRRVRRDLPPGYEVSAVSGVTAPQSIWGIGGDGMAKPLRCAPLADPAGGHGQSAQGISGSGPGGTVYTVVVAAPTGQVALDQSLLGPCRQWSMTGKRASARVRLVDPPHVDDAGTLGLAAEIITSVEGGNEIDSRASTFTAYVGDYYVFTALVSDPGSPNQALSPQFAADLLAKTVSALRS